MTVDCHPTTVEKARDRGGDKDPNRPEDITEALEAEQLGYGEGEPLVGESYQSYPSREELSNPSRGEFLRNLLAHPQVGGLDDAVEELTGGRDSSHLSNWLATVEAATDAHSLEVDTLTAKGSDQGGDNTLTSILGYEPPKDVVDRDNPLLIAELYTLGLSVSEVADILDERVEGNVREGHIRDTLKRVGLLEGATRDEQREAVEENDSRLGGTTMGFSESGDTRGLTVSTSDFA